MTLRARVLANTDAELLRQEFISGLQMVLLRRYQGAARLVRSIIDPSVEDCRCLHVDSRTREELHAVVQEMVSNDLKYGNGLSVWKFSCEGGNVCLDLEAQSTYDGRLPGSGTRTIRNRAASLGGSVDARLASGSYRCRIAIPCPGAGNCPVAQSASTVHF